MPIFSRLGVVALLFVAVPTQAQPKPEPAFDQAALADRIVGKVANVKEGEIVHLLGPPSDLVLLEEMVVAVRKRGAFAILTVGTESLRKKLIATPEKYDVQTNAAALALAKLINVRIALPIVRDPTLLATVPSERLAKWNKADSAVDLILEKRNVRIVELGNGLLPTAQRAKELGLSQPELTKLFWDGVSADYSALETKARTVRDQLAKGGELRITHPNGTDLRMVIRGRKVFVSDGTISDADRKAGGPAVLVWLPACEIFVSPVPGSAEGKIVDDRFVSEGKEVTGMTVDVKGGKIASIGAKSGWDLAKSRYEAAGPRKAEIGVFDIGCNTAIKSGGKLETYIGAGMVTIGAGNNTWAGGTNKEPHSTTFQLAGTTVTLDGKPIVENGALK